MGFAWKQLRASICNMIFTLHVVVILELLLLTDSVSTIISVCKSTEEIELESAQETQALKTPGNGQIQYRSPSAAELLESQQGQAELLQMEKISRRTRHETVYDKIQRYRGAILMISVPVILITLLCFLMPSCNSASSIESFPRRFSPNPKTRGYAVIFDAGSSGSRVHVFCFDKQLDLIPIGKELELFVLKKPGLSSFANDPKAAAHSLLELLEKAEAAVPRELQHDTPVRVGATTGLRQLDGDTPDMILQAARGLLKNKGTFKSKADWVTVLDGNQEGAYRWVTINYLLGNLGKEYPSTVGVVDLGGGSVQMAYVISDADAAKAHRLSDGEDTCVQEMYLKEDHFLE